MTELRRPPLALRLQAEREARGWSKKEMARRLLSAAGYEGGSAESLTRQIRDWEAGKHFPRDWTTAYATAFGVDEDRLFSTRGLVQSLSEDDEMERRKLLQALTVLGVTSSPLLEALQNIRDSVDRTVGRDEDGHLDEWEDTVAEYGYSYLVLPPQRLFTDLAADLVTVQQIMSRGDGGDRLFPSWARVTSGLAALMAKTLCNLGQPRQARRWWVTAQQAADTSRDADLSLWTTGERLVHGLYERRPTPVLLRKASAITERASDTPCRGLAHIRTVRAQLLALDGQAAAATAELRRSGEVFGRLPTSVTNDTRSIAGWGEDRLRYTEAWVYAHLGQRDRLDRAVSRAHEVLPSTNHRVRAQVSLLQALGHVHSGDVTVGVRQAQAVYEGHPAEQLTTMVTSLADQVLAAVLVQSRREPAVATYRELITSGAQRREIT